MAYLSPYELDRILSFMHPSTLHVAAMVCKRWRSWVLNREQIEDEDSLSDACADGDVLAMMKAKVRPNYPAVAAAIRGQHYSLLRALANKHPMLISVYGLKLACTVKGTRMLWAMLELGAMDYHAAFAYACECVNLRAMEILLDMDMIIPNPIRDADRNVINTIVSRDRYPRLLCTYGTFLENRNHSYIPALIYSMAWYTGMDIEYGTTQVRTDANAAFADALVNEGLVWTASEALRTSLYVTVKPPYPVAGLPLRW